MKHVKLLATLAAVILLGCVAAARVRSEEPPAVVSAVAPAYPPVARASRVAGEFFVDVKIDGGGKVTSAEAAGAHKLVEKAVVDAARRWRFAPAGPRGRAERMARLTFSFMVRSQDAPAEAGTTVFYPHEYKVEVRSVEYAVD